MRGRRPAGPEYVDKLDGSEQSKKRLRVILETLSGHCTVQEACAQLELGEVRFNQLRQEALQGALATIEPKLVGRPRTTPPEEERIQALEQSLADKLHEAQVREEIALAMPRRPTSSSPEKKTSRQARPGWWKKKR
jgi:hypothetical protein